MGKIVGQWQKFNNNILGEFSAEFLWRGQHIIKFFAINLTYSHLHVVAFHFMTH